MNLGGTATIFNTSSGNKFIPRVRGNIIERFWEKVVPDLNSGCWFWCGDDNGKYGSLGFWDNEMKRTVRLYAHRVSYVLHKGFIPDGLEIDHLCRQPLCVNPSHLEAVTHRENSRRIPVHRNQNTNKEYCGKGHPLFGENLRISSPRKHNGRTYRICKTCEHAHQKRWRDANPRSQRRA